MLGGEAAISGTVFVDNGVGVGGIAGNGIKDGAEPDYTDSYTINFTRTDGPFGCANCPPAPAGPAPQPVCSPEQTTCNNRCYSDPTFAESLGGVFQCLNYCNNTYCATQDCHGGNYNSCLTTCAISPFLCIWEASSSTEYCTEACGAAPPPNPVPTQSGANYRIAMADGSNIPYGTYTVTISGSPLALTEPPSRLALSPLARADRSRVLGLSEPPAPGSLFTVIAGRPENCSVGSSRNAQCYLGGIRNLHFGIAPPDASIVFNPSLSDSDFDYTIGETANFTYTVTNTHPVAVEVGFWPKGGTPLSPLPQVTAATCVPGTPSFLPPIQTVPANTTQDVTFLFNVRTTGATAYAAVSFGCAPPDANWINNVSAGQTYIVNSPPAWFEANDGDVGAHTSIIQPGTPVTSSSDYLLASGTLTNVTTSGWRLSGYSLPQVLPSVYDYIESRFRSKATYNRCSLAGLVSAQINYCDSGDVTISGSIPPNHNIVWFIDEDLIVDSNFSVPLNSTIIFIVKGNITVNTNVTEADGIYVAGGSFTDVDYSGNQGPQLEIDGAIYATGDVNLLRVLTPAALNVTTPAEVINFRPKYIEALNDILGASAITWQEVAP